MKQLYYSPFGARVNVRFTRAPEQTRRGRCFVPLRFVSPTFATDCQSYVDRQPTNLDNGTGPPRFASGPVLTELC